MISPGANASVAGMDGSPGNQSALSSVPNAAAPVGTGHASN
jgi:hypothetical protein